MSTDNAILEYAVPPFEETYNEPVTPPADGSVLDKDLAYRSLLDLQPIPVFSDRRLPQAYK